MENLEVYAHIHNGGVSFEVTNERGPTIEIKASHFGNQTNHIKLHVDVDVLKNLADMFYKASTAEYSEEYVCAAKVPDKSIGDSQGAIEKT
jgi:hypothetical protein